MDYRKLYMNHYGIHDPGPEYVIHHIDLDRSNNNIDNLIMLPERLHHRYHWCISQLRSEAKRTTIEFDAAIGANTNSYDLSVLRHLVDTMMEIREWQLIKNNSDMELGSNGYDRLEL